MPVLDRKLLVVTGKGGTGKTAVSASLARAATAAGKSVLLCEIDTAGDIASAFDTERPAFDPKEVEPNLFLMRMDTEAALSEYLRINLKLPMVLRVGPFSRAFDFVATAAPGVREMLTIGKLCWEVKRENYDLVIADAPASGHVVSQISSPQAIGSLVNSGPLDRQTKWMGEMLRDPERTGAVVVTTPEEVPISETIELIGRLQNETRTPLAAVVVNRTLPELFLREDEAVFSEMCSDVEKLGDIPGNIEGVLQLAQLALALRRTQTTHLDELLAVAPETLFLPQCFGSLEPTSVVRALTDALAGELS